MSNTLFTPGLIVDQPHLDLETMEEFHHAMSWNIQCMQIELGDLLVSIMGVHTPNLQLVHTFYSLGTMRKSSFPPGVVLLVYLGGKDKVFQNKRLSADELLVLQEGDEMDILSNTKSDIYLVAVEKELLSSAFHSYFSKTLDEALKEKRFVIKADKLDHFIAGLDRWGSYLKSMAFTSQDEKPYDQIEQAIISHVFNCIAFDAKPKKRKKFYVKRIRDALHENISAAVSITQLVKELDISERQLHNTFRSIYGLSPKKYLQSLRLNAVRKELLSADSSQMYLSDIAYKYGFTHMSHFTNEYKKMFAELPSTTLQK